MSEDTKNTTNETLSKVPELTLVFWIVKILATTLGETGGDAVSMSMNLGYLVSTAIFAVIFVGMVIVQINSAEVSSDYLLDDDCGIDDRGHDTG